LTTIRALSKYKHADHFNALHDKKAEKNTATQETESASKIEKVEELTSVENTKSVAATVEKPVAIKKPAVKTTKPKK